MVLDSPMFQHNTLRRITPSTLYLEIKLKDSLDLHHQDTVNINALSLEATGWQKKM